MELVLQEILLSFLEQLTLGVRSTVAKKLLRITVTWLRKKASLLNITQLKDATVIISYQYLSTGDMEVLPAHASVTLNAKTRPRQLHILAQRAVSLAPVLWKYTICTFPHQQSIYLVIQLKEGGLGDPVLVKEADLGDVEGANQVDPVANIGLLVNASNSGADLAVGGFDAGHTGLTKPRLRASLTARVAVQASRLLKSKHVVYLRQ